MSPVDIELLFVSESMTVHQNKNLFSVEIKLFKQVVTQVFIFLQTCSLHIAAFISHVRHSIFLNSIATSRLSKI